MRVYDTAARTVVPFEPRPASPVSMYACGPTVYDHAHIGNFRAFLFFDLVHRYLEWRGHEVRFVMNLTDVDDKVIEASAENEVDISQHTSVFTEALLADAAALGMRPADAMPRATEHVEAMVDFVALLLKRGHAYTADDGAVYFSVESFPRYGRLRGLDPCALVAGARVVQDEYDKADVRDFALWKPADDAAERVGAAWDSPWGRGRPGWHLECSVMSTSELGMPIDIHLGGEDLVFPHHENEIAQSEAAYGEPFVRHWLHVKHLFVDGRKMSKSLGNHVTVRALLTEGHDPAAIRHLLISSHYRGELNFTREGLEASGRAVQRVLDLESRLRTLPVMDDAPPTGLAEHADRAIASLRTAMDEDFNSADALAALFILVGDVNGELASRDKVSGTDRDAALNALHSIDRVLGLIETAKAGRRLSPEETSEIDLLVLERTKARANRDFARADDIRHELRQRGIALEDGVEGTRWKVVG